MIKNIALFLASTSFACVLPASISTAPKMGGYEALMTERSVDSEEYYRDGYNYFGDCIVEATTSIKIDELDRDFDTVARSAFGNWYPQYNIEYFPQSIYSGISEYYQGDITTDLDIFNFRENDTHIGNYVLRQYRREFDCYTTYEDDDFYYEDLRPYKWRVYQPTPIIVPYVFLEQFLLGLYLNAQGVDVSFEGDLYVYNFNDHYFYRRYLSLRGAGEIGGNLMHSISPSSLNSIFNNDQYIFYQDRTAINYDPLYYDGGWVMCRFDLRWTTSNAEHVTDYGYLCYSNRYASEGVFNLMNNADPIQLEYDNLRIWNMVFGDTVYLEPINPPDIIFGTVEGFLATEFIPDFTFGDLLLIVLGVMVFGAFLKVFLGG